MDELSTLLHLFEKFKEVLVGAASSKKSAAIKKASTALKNCISFLEPPTKKTTQKELKERLLTDGTASRIRNRWAQNKALIDLGAIAHEVGLTLKRPTIDHIIIAFYYPSNRLEELATRFEKLAVSNPGIIEIQRFQGWRGELRALKSKEQIQSALQELLQNEGIEIIRRFAVHLNTRDLSGKRKLPKSAPEAKLVDAVAGQLWKEKIISKAQEGTL